MIEHVMPLCVTASWVYVVSMLVQSIVYEKEQRLKEVYFICYHRNYELNILNVCISSLLVGCCRS
jgi:hypothetical protein